MSRRALTLASAAGFALLGAALAAPSSPPQKQQQRQQKKEGERPGKESAEARLKLARRIYEGTLELLKAPPPPEGDRPDELRLDRIAARLHAWARRVADLRGEGAPAEEVAGFLNDHVEKMRTFEQAAANLDLARLSVDEITFYRMEAEAWLARARAGGGDGDRGR